jgi:hypothetical protein
MSSPLSGLDEALLLRHKQELLRRIPPAAINRCQHLAWSLEARLPSLLSTGDPENRLFFRTLVRAIEEQGPNFAAMSVEDLAILIIIQGADEARQETEDILEEMRKTNEQKNKLSEMISSHLKHRKSKGDKWPPT